MITIKSYIMDETEPKEAFSKRDKFVFNMPANAKILSIEAYPSIYSAKLEAIVDDSDTAVKKRTFKVFTENSSEDLFGYFYILTLPKVGTQYTRHVFEMKENN